MQWLVRLGRLCFGLLVLCIMFQAIYVAMAWAVSRFTDPPACQVGFAFPLPFASCPQLGFGPEIDYALALPGAVLTRVAASHIRVGTFQYFAAQRDVEALEALTAHAIARHYPEADGALGLLDKVIEKQAALIAQWLGLGFVHGVMNTDNMTISGEL